MQGQAKDKVFLCAGGTGGHMFPALALAEDLKNRNLDVIFLTDKRGLKYTASVTDMTVKVIASATMPGGLIGKAKGVVALGRGYMQAKSLIKQFKPAIVIGFGGYPSLPGMVAAQRHHIPTIIHEQNAVLGKANAYLAPKADRIALSLPNRASLHEADAVRAVVTGNPVRRDIAALYSNPYKTPDENDAFHLVIMGGSQGAKSLGDIVPQALMALPQDLKDRLHIIHQAPEQSVDTVRDHYKEASLNAEVTPFIQNVADILKETHLIIARSGASTVAEVSIAGVPAIYVPYPHHADHQQRVNAQSIVDKGGAWLMEEGQGFTASNLSAKIESLMLNPEGLFNAAEAARNCGRPEAARKLGNLVVAMMKGWDKTNAKSFDYTQGWEG